MFFSMLFAFSSLTAHAQEIVNGELSSENPQVVALFAADDDGYGFQFCSATVIGFHTAVTAAHCVEAMEEVAGYGYGKLWLKSGTEVYDGVSESVLATSWVAHPDYDSSTLDHDIGLVHFDNDTFDFEPMPINRNPFGTTQIGQDYRYIGWGITLDGAQDNGTKRYADIPMYDYDDMFQYGWDVADNQNVCSGDSGGAVLEFHGDGWELSGVNSWVSDDDSTYCEGGLTGGTRVDTHLDWIEEYTEVWSYSELEEYLEDHPPEEEEAPEEEHLPDEVPDLTHHDETQNEAPESALVTGCSTSALPWGNLLFLLPMGRLRRRNRT